MRAFRVFDAHARKQTVFAGLLDGTSDEVLFEGNSSFLEGVKRLVDDVPVPMPQLDDGEGLDVVTQSEPAAQTTPTDLLPSAAPAAPSFASGLTISTSQTAAYASPLRPS